MWIYNRNFGKWSSSNDSLKKSDFDLLKQELSATRYYSRILSGATFMPVNDLDDIYDILGEQRPKSWYISTLGSEYSDTLAPAKNVMGIDEDTSYEYYTKFISEYGLTLKTLFTADRLIKDSAKNYYHADVATTEQIDLTQNSNSIVIDGVLLRPGHRILVKDQKNVDTTITGIEPNSYLGAYSILEDIGGTKTYEYYNDQNGIYVYDGRRFVREQVLDDYSNCVRYSIHVNMGTVNTGRQFHLKRLTNGYFPQYGKSESMNFVEKKNWMMRNRVDYNNLFEINYFDVIKHGTQSYHMEGVTYSIPPRTIAVGEFGVILNTQNLSGIQGTSNIINNKYKVNLRSISQTSTHYWVCGDDSILLKVRKHDFLIERSIVDTLSNLTSVSFFNDLRGAAVGEFNSIFVTTDGGKKWNKLKIADFAPYSYNKVLFADASRFYVGGKNGVFLEMYEDQSGWTALKRRIFKEIDEDDEYLLADSINDLYRTTVAWGLSYSFGSTQSTTTPKDIMLIAANNGSLIAYDLAASTEFDFLYLDFGKSYGDIRNITRQTGTDNFYFTAADGLYSFDINDFKYIGVGNTYSNTIAGTYATLESSLYANEIFDYEGSELIIAGNNSLLKSSNYGGTLDFKLLDDNFEDRLKSKLLFMDYDIGAKLNWFTDQGDYRMPNSVTFSVDNAFQKKADGTISNTRSAEYLLDIGFGPIVYGATAPSMMTQSECNWTTYWIDTQKTFEYYSEYPLNDYSFSGITGSMVLISTTFSNVSGKMVNGTPPSVIKSNKINLYKGMISNDLVAIKKLAPSFAYSGIESSRYDKLSRPNITAPVPVDPSSIKLYLYDYLIILKVPAANYDYIPGDVARIESGVVDGNFIVNKVWTNAGSKYVYMYSEFNQTMIADLIQNAGETMAESKVTITNLNRYSEIEELVYNFSQHPIGNAYKMKITGSASYMSYDLEISPKFNSLTSYYNLATKVYSKTYKYLSNTYGNYSKEMIYTGGFLKFGYTATYNLLDYLESINKISSGLSTFYATKEYLAMPVYREIPLGSLGAKNAYIDYSGMTQSSTTGNKVIFGEGLKLEWESIMINTFVDVSIYQPLAVNTYSTERLLVMSKYKIENIDGSGANAYAIEFQKRLNFQLNTSLAGGTIDIVSRRSLLQISEDLQEMNNIHKAKLRETQVSGAGLGYSNYQRELNFKVPTDSYAKIFMSDSETVDSLSAIMYIDYKNELAMNITKLERDFNVPISNTVDFAGQLFITCSQKHMLSKGDGVVLDFDGGADSSQELNQNYFGYRVVTQVYGDYDFAVDLPYGNEPFVGADTGYVRYVKKDPFLNFQPVDLIDIGLDKKGSIAIELGVENTKLENGKFRLVNVDFDKHRFKLIDGLNIETVSLKYPWILEAEISGAVIGLDEKSDLQWYKGIWEGGRWFGGNWISGTWKMGDWYAGTWNSKTIKDRKISIEIDKKSSDETKSIWHTGRWFGGTWNNGTWMSGRFYDGAWNAGVWNSGTWNDGTWNGGRFIGGIWVTGEWNGGRFNTDSDFSYWIDGAWNGGDFENGMWYNGSFESKSAISRFGTKAYNSRTATWHGGKWISGSFFSGMGSMPDVSEVHKYSIWHTGQWISGDFYGGIAYNIDFKSGTWHGGILEDIQIIGMNEKNNSFILNGIFKFNIGDEIHVIDNGTGNELSSEFGSDDEPKKHVVLYVAEDSINKLTEVYVATRINEFSGRFASYKKKQLGINATFSANSTISNTITTSGVSETIKDVKAKIRLSSENKVVEKYVPVAQYRTISQTFPSLTPAGNIIPSLTYPGIPLSIPATQTNFLSQNVVGMRKSTTAGTIVLHWGLTPVGYFGPGCASASNLPLKYVLNNTMISTYGPTYQAKERVLDPFTRVEISSTPIPTLTMYSTSDEIYGYRIDISEDHLFGSYYAQYEVGAVYSHVVTGLDPNRYFYFRVSEIRSSGIGSLRISLSSPSGQTICLKEFNEGNVDTDMVGAIFSYDQSLPALDSGRPTYTGTFKMKLGTQSSPNNCQVLESTSMTTRSLLSKNNFANFSILTGTKQYANGNWTLSIENTSGVNIGHLYDWEIQFGYSDEIGAQLYDKVPAIDTGLKIVSNFQYANWKTGIWTNGIFEDGVFESGIWYNGIFNANWG